MAIKIYILIITLNVNGLNAPTKRHRLAKWGTRHTYIHTYIHTHTHTHTVYNGPILDLGHIQTASEGMEKGIPCKYTSKESWSSNTPIRQNRL